MKRHFLKFLGGFMVGGSCWLSAVSPAGANNLSINDVVVVNQDIGDQTWDIRFDLSWDNSWRLPGAPSESANWDAVWLFAKYSVFDSGTSTWGVWKHCPLISPGALAPAGATFAHGVSDAINPGVFIYRSAEGYGTVSWSDVTLRWDYGADSVADNARVRVQVFGIEMVYITESSFYVGDGGSNTNTFYEGGGTSAFQISSEGQIAVANSAGSLYYRNDTANAGDRSGPIPAAFPKGYNAFYLMKYEITQQQYVDFLNTLDGTQQATRASATTAGNFHQSNGSTNTPTNRGGIKCSIAPVGATPGVYVNDLNNNDVYNETDDGQTLAANWLSWADGASYAAWAGLRPFTELEFEKAARGPLPAVVNEYAWGTATIAASAYTLDNHGAGNETIIANYSTTAGNAAYATTTNVGGIQGPLRAGIFSGNVDNTGRMTSGGSYYGVMELSGNVWERPVTVGNATGRLFTGSHGSGTLDGNGNFTNGDWPGTDAVGAGYRGASWNSVGAHLRVADRDYAAYTSSGRVNNNGARAARTSP